MAIVARRVIQRLIRENAEFLSREQRSRHVDAIERNDDDSLAAEWEILVLNALSKYARVEHEPLLGSRRPDILARLSGPADEMFVADVATAYETGYHERNPVRRLSDEIHARARRMGLAGHGFYIHAGGELQGESRKQQMILKLPETPQ